MPKRSDSKRISRLRLTLPLNSPYLAAFAASGDEEQKLVSATGSQWTLSAGPASTGSIYSQESFTNSPIPLRSAKVDKRRFALALQSANLNWEGSWSAPIRDPRSPDAATFVLDLHSATLEPEEEDEFIFNKSEDTLLKKSDTDVPELASDTAKTELLQNDGALKETKKEFVSKEVAQVKTKKPRSKSVFGKIFSRRSTHPSLSSFAEASDGENKPLLPTLPPRIEVTLPSPGIRGVHDMREPEITPADLVRSLQSANIPGNRATMPSGWKPRRPPSPIPKSLKKNGKNGHKRNAASVSLPVAQSPIPPLPTRPLGGISGAAAAPVATQAPASTPTPDAATTVSPAVQSQKSRRRSSWTESLQVRVKARAMKSAYYAPVPESILSPPTSAM